MTIDVLVRTIGSDGKIKGSAKMNENTLGVNESHQRYLGINDYLNLIKSGFLHAGAKISVPIISDGSGISLCTYHAHNGTYLRTTGGEEISAQEILGDSHWYASR